MLTTGTNIIGTYNKYVGCDVIINYGEQTINQGVQPSADASQVVNDEVEAEPAAPVSEPPAPVSEAPESICEDERFARAILHVMEVRTPSGAYLFTSKSQWVSIYRILVDYHGFPEGYTEFLRRIEAMHTDFRVPCTYDALADISGVFTRRFSQWDVNDYDSDRTAYFHAKREIALKLKEALK